MWVRDLLHILGSFIYNICQNLKLWTLVFPFGLKNGTIKLIFMWSILIELLRERERERERER